MREAISLDDCAQSRADKNKHDLHKISKNNTSSLKEIMKQNAFFYLIIKQFVSVLRDCTSMRLSLLCLTHLIL
jgi:hypothetical protein